MTDIVSSAVALAAAVGLFCLAAPAVAIPGLRRAGAVDVPSARSSHEFRAVRGVGVVPWTAVSLALVIAATTTPLGAGAPLVGIIAVAAVAAGVLGLVEDLRGLSVRVRAGTHVAIGAAASTAAVVSTGAHWSLAVVGAVAVAGFVNTANFMDGLDGMSGLHGVVFGAAACAVGVLTQHEWLVVVGLVTASAFAAFLPWNLGRRGTFLGDVGSYLLGAVVATTAVAAVAVGVPALAILGATAPYLADTSTTLLRRVLGGRHWAEPHREHVYQRASRLGLGHLGSSTSTAVFSAATAAAGLGALSDDLGTALLCAALVLGLTALYLCTPRLLTLRARRASADAGARAPDAAPTILFIETTDFCVESHLAGQLASLRESGWRPVVATTDTGILPRVLAADEVVGHALTIRREPAPLHDLVTLLRLALLMRRERPALVVYGTPKAALLGSAAARLTRVRRRLYFVYGLRAETMTGLGRTVVLAAERLALACSTDSLAVSHSMRDQARRLGLDTTRMAVVGRGSANGVDVAAFRAAGGDDGRRRRLRDRLGAADDDLVVGFVGRVTADKGVDCLVGAVRALRARGLPARLVLVGPDEGTSALLAETRRDLASSWVTLLGQVDDTAEVYAAFDVFCLPSRREGLPTVVLEAAAAGVPVVVTDATGMRDAVDSGRSALVVPVDDRPALTEALHGLLTDPSAAGRLRTAASRLVDESFSHRVVADSLARHYEAVVSRPDAGRAGRRASSGAPRLPVPAPPR